MWIGCRNKQAVIQILFPGKSICLHRQGSRRSWLGSRQHSFIPKNPCELLKDMSPFEKWGQYYQSANCLENCRLNTKYILYIKVTPYITLYQAYFLVTILGNLN